MAIPAHLELSARSERRRARLVRIYLEHERVAIAGGSLLAVLLVWEAFGASGLVDPLFISSPTLVARAAWLLSHDRDFWTDLQISATEFMLGYAAALAVAIPAAGPVQAADLIPFKIGISAPVVTVFPVWMGEAGGFYAKEGLKVEGINMEGGTRGLQVLLSGEIQAMHVGLAPRSRQPSKAPTCGSSPRPAIPSRLPCLRSRALAWAISKARLSASAPLGPRPTLPSVSCLSSLASLAPTSPFRRSAAARSASAR